RPGPEVRNRMLRTVGSPPQRPRISAESRCGISESELARNTPGTLVFGVIKENHYSIITLVSFRYL
ncbi:MAG: hypothetical protein LBT00_15020, partial [Spirochaetaceae bacterium]|nr:hypothetical protein [Spirochaetaceae bacterium]